MTVAERKERWRGARHWAIVAIIVMALITAPLEWLPSWPWYLDYPMIVVQVLFMTGMVVHLRDLCERCIGSMPLDPEKAVAKEKFFLWLNHKWVFRIAMLVAILASGFLMKKHSIGMNSLNSFFDLWIALSYLTTLRHSRLHPWCPWCRGGGGGGGMFEEAPDPVDDDSKPVPV